MNRILYLDALRGFALMGLLLVHMPIFGLVSVMYGGDLPADAGVADHIAQFIYYLLCDGKFFPLFAFLFGYGFALQLRGTTGENPFIFLRRLAFLGIAGILHNLLFFSGDILLSYSLMGLGLFILRSRQDVVFLRIAVVFWLLTGLTYYLLGSFGEPTTEMIAETRRLIESNSGSFAQSVTGRLPMALPTFGFIVLFNWSSSIALMSLGFILGRRGTLELDNPFAGLPSWTLPLAAVCGLSAAAFHAFAEESGSYKAIASALAGLTAPALSLVYARGVLYIIRHSNVAIWLAQAGRMSLTLYLSESVIMSFLFFGWGLDLAEKLTFSRVMALSVPVYAALLIFANLWFRFFRTGPAEGFLRSFAYRKPLCWK